MKRSVKVGVGFMLGCLTMAASGHEVTYEDKVCECVGDVDNSGTVDELDVQQVLSCFGGICVSSDDPDYDCPLDTGCVEDVNHNHRVGEGDLDMLLANWGDCPLEGDVNRDGDLDRRDVDRVVADLDLDCRSELDGNGRVNGNDIAIAEAAWGPTRDPHLGTDVNRDGVLTIIDLLLVIETMGLNCRSDVDRDGIVDCLDVNWVCERTQSDCSDLACAAPPGSPY